MSVVISAQEQHVLISISAESHHVPISVFLDRIVQRIVGVAAWLNVVLALTILVTVVVRYGFHRNGLLLDWGLVPMEELQWHFYSVPFMFGLAYAITNDSHIRIDIVHMSLPKQLQHLFEILGILILLLPVVIILFDFSLDYAIYAYTHHESSQSPSGLPYRWIVKSVIPISMVLMMIAAVSSLIEHAVLLVLHGKELKNTSRLSLAGRLFLPQLKEQNKSNEGARN